MIPDPRAAPEHLADSAAAAGAALERRLEPASIVAVLSTPLTWLRSRCQVPRAAWAPTVVVLYSILLSLPLVFVHVFYIDWFNHLWIAQYVADRLSSEHAVPLFVNVDNAVGNPFLLFYGSGLYLLISPLVYTLGADVGMRLAVFAAFLLPSLAILRLFRHAVSDRGPSVAATIALSTSLYNLTNIYTRGATTEFFAYQLLILSMAVVLDALAFPQRDRPARLLVAITAAGLALLAHPPTAYLWVIFLGVPFAAYAILSRRSLLLDRRSAIPALFGMLIAATALAFWSKFVLSDARLTGFGSKALSVFTFFPWSIDHWMSRILPWPMDFRVEIAGYNLVSTPFLSAPINMAGLLLFVSLMVSEARARSFGSARLWFTALVAGAIVSSFLLSLPFGSLEQAKWPDGSPAFGVLYSSETSWRTLLLGRVQFAYRLVNIVNASIVFGFLVLAVTRRDHTGNEMARLRGTSWQRLALAAAAVCLVGAGVKLAEVYREYELLPAIAAKQKAPAPAAHLPDWTHGIYAWVSQDNLNKLRAALGQTDVVPETEYGFATYAMPSLFPHYVESTKFPLQQVDLKLLDSRRATIAAHCSTACALSTTLFPSPYSRIDVNGTPISARLLRTLKDRVVVLLPEAGDYTILVHLGTWETTAFGYAVAALAVTFWLSGLMAIGLSLRITGLSRSPEVGTMQRESGPEKSSGA